jgi:glycosyltransferase involved in cell wall biosynthesis
MENKLKILYLSLNSGLRGPFPKIDPLLITALKDLDCQITKIAWGRHSENENIIQKIIGRLRELIFTLLNLIRQHPDIIYIATTLDEYALLRDIPLLLATRWFPAKKVLMMHGSKTDPLTDKGHYLYKLLSRFLILLSDAILVLSSEELANWKKFESRGRYYRVDNPFISNSDINTDKLIREIPETKSHPILLFAGRLIKAKGIFDLLDAMPIIISKVNCQLLIAGEGKEKVEIVNFINNANLEQYVSILGYVDSDHLSGFYRLSSIFVLPTYFGEGFPTVITEAMSYGLPIVTTRIRGAVDHLVEGENVLFVNPRKPAELAFAIEKLLLDKTLCQKMSKNNSEKVKEFAPDIVSKKYYSIFKEVINGSNEY